MKNISVVFKKQMMDTLKNKTVLIQFILFPIMTLIMENAIRMEGMPEHFFVKLFSVMYMGMAPLTAMSAILSEEKEKNTLRVLLMANVKPWEYLIGVGSYVWGICMIGACIMGACGGFKGEALLFYLLFLGIGFLVSVVAGAAIGIFAANQMMATSLVMPVMMVLSFAPMLSQFNATIEKCSKWLYTQQINSYFSTMSFDGLSAEKVMILVGNVIVFTLLFAIAYTKKGME